jgi:hypothetical protein
MSLGHQVDGKLLSTTEQHAHSPSTGHHLRRRSAGPVELRIATGLLGCRYGITDLVKNKSLSSDIVQAFRSIDWPLGDAHRICIADFAGAFALR